MNDRSRFADALLGSPIPPPNWRNERYAGSGWKSRRGRRAGRAYFIAPGEVQAALAEAATHTNPPVIQGWAWLLAIALASVEVVGLIGLRDGGLAALVMVLAPLPLWFVAIGLGAAVSRDVDVRDGSVFVRSWLGEWVGRSGRLVGSVASVRMVELSVERVRLTGDSGEVVVSLAFWPTSSRRALLDRLGEHRSDGHHRGARHRT